MLIAALLVRFESQKNVYYYQENLTTMLRYQKACLSLMRLQMLGEHDYHVILRQLVFVHRFIAFRLCLSCFCLIFPS